MKFGKQWHENFFLHTTRERWNCAELIDEQYASLAAWNAGIEK